jgi:hypothetical protein
MSVQSFDHFGGAELLRTVGATETIEGDHNTFGRSGHCKLQRLCRLCASRFGQSPFRSDNHFDILPKDVIATLAGALGAFDAKHVELAFKLAEDEIGSHGCGAARSLDHFVGAGEQRRGNFKTERLRGG